MDIYWNSARSDGSQAPMVYSGMGGGGNGLSISTLLRGIPATMQLFEGSDTGPQQAVANRLGMLSEAMYAPNSPLYQQLYRQNLNQNQQNLAQTIAELQRQNRKATVTGRTPLFSSERGGESVFRGLMQEQGAIGDRAREATLNQLGRGAQSTALAFEPFRSVSQQEYENRGRETQGFSNIASMLSSLFGL